MRALITVEEVSDGTRTSRPRIEWGRAAGLSDVGRSRRRNEDAFVVDSRRKLLLVSDGMGGHNGGDVAAHIVAEGLPTMLDERLGPERRGGIPQILRSTLMDVSRAVWSIADGRKGLSGMGATVVLAMLRGSALFIANLGDSRAYMLHNGELRQVTEDHSLVQRLIREGRLTVDQASHHPYSGVITRHMGMRKPHPPDVFRIEPSPGDRLLLCSDGLTGMLRDAEIEEILRNTSCAERACRRLVTHANAAGGQDNITVVVADFDPARRAKERVPRNEALG